MKSTCLLVTVGAKLTVDLLWVYVIQSYYNYNYHQQKVIYLRWDDLYYKRILFPSYEMTNQKLGSFCTFKNDMTPEKCRLPKKASSLNVGTAFSFWQHKQNRLILII